MKPLRLFLLFLLHTLCLTAPAQEHTQSTMTSFFDSGPLRYGCGNGRGPTQRQGVLLRLNDPNLRSVNVPYNVSRGVTNYYIEIVGSGAFDGCQVESVTLNDHVKHIESYAFRYCPLKSFRCPAKLRSIGREAFAWCSDLEQITTDMNLKSVGVSAFRGCTKLRRFDCPPDLHTIEAAAFMSCSSLEYVTLSRDLTNLGELAFDAVPSLKAIVCHRTRPLPAPQAFSRSVLADVWLVVPDGCVQAYRSTEGWRDFVHVIEYSQLNAQNSH